MTRAIYVRTSTDDNDGAAQLHELRTYAQQRGWEHVCEFVDLGQSGTKNDRYAWVSLQEEVRRGRVTEWAATELARLGRGGVMQVAPFLAECVERGVRVVLTRSGLDYGTPYGRLVANILLEVAAMERELITERVRAGVRRAQSEGTRSGKPIGRPRVAVDVAKVREMRARRYPWEWIARQTGLGVGTLRRALQRPAKTP